MLSINFAELASKAFTHPQRLERRLKLGIVQPFQVGPDLRKRTVHVEALLDIAAVPGDGYRDEPQQQTPVIPGESIPVGQDIGQWAGFVANPGVKAGDELFAIDENVLPGHDPQQQVRARQSVRRTPMR